MIVNWKAILKIPSFTLELGLALSLVRLVNSGSPLRSFPYRSRSFAPLYSKTVN